jgi:hypothetical protein
MYKLSHAWMYFVGLVVGRRIAGWDNFWAELGVVMVASFGAQLVWVITAATRDGMRRRAAARKKAHEVVEAAFRASMGKDMIK